MRHFLNRLPIERYHKRWIAYSADFEHRLEKYWFNSLLLLGVIGAWWMAASLAVNLASPFGFMLWVANNDTMFLAALAASLVVIVLFFIAKEQGARIRTVILMIAWAAVISGLWQAFQPGGAAAGDESFAHLSVQIYQGHPGWLAGWYAISGLHTLHFVMKNQRAKLKAFWLVVLGGFATLSLGYLISPPLALLVALTSPHELLNRWIKAPSEADVRLRGTRLTPQKEANYQYRKQLDLQSRTSRETFSFGQVDVPVRELTTHLVAAGSAGSGKSINLKLVMQSVLPLVTPFSGVRAVVFDPKHNAEEEILGIEGISAEVHVLNAFQRGTASWNMAKDITTYAQAQGFAEIMIPETKPGEHQDPFWRYAAINALCGIVLLFMMNAPGNWTLADVVRAFGSGEILIRLLASNPHTACYINSLGSDKTRDNILTSVCTEIYRYLPIAALWQHATTSVSITEWLQGGQIWLLGENKEAKLPMNALNRLILTRMSQALLNEKDHLDPRTFVILDELQSIHVESLQELATMGRSKGICLILAFQSIQGMYQKYGRETADSLLGQIRHKAFLKMSDPQTASYASSNMGEIELKRSKANTQFKTGAAGLINWSTRTGGSEAIQETKLVMPSDLIDIPAVNTATNQGITGFYQAGNLIWKNYTPWDALNRQLHPPDPFTRRKAAPSHWQMLDPWTEEDWHRLGIAEVMRQATQTNPSNTHDD